MDTNTQCQIIRSDQDFMDLYEEAQPPRVIELPGREDFSPFDSSASNMRTGCYSHPTELCNPDQERLLGPTIGRYHATVDPKRDGETTYELPSSSQMVSRMDSDNSMPNPHRALLRQFYIPREANMQNTTQLDTKALQLSH